MHVAQFHRYGDKDWSFPEVLTVDEVCGAREGMLFHSLFLRADWP